MRTGRCTPTCIPWSRILLHICPRPCLVPILCHLCILLRVRVSGANRHLPDSPSLSPYFPSTSKLALILHDDFLNSKSERLVLSCVLVWCASILTPSPHINKGEPGGSRPSIGALAPETTFYIQWRADMWKTVARGTDFRSADLGARPT